MPSTQPPDMKSRTEAMIGSRTVSQSEQGVLDLLSQSRQYYRPTMMFYAESAGLQLHPTKW